jgi:hypothetical protein
MLRTAVVILALSPTCAAFGEGHALAVRVGALGIGPEYTYQLNDRVALRGAVYGSELGFDDEQSGIEYDFDVVWDSIAVGVDFHPLKSALRLSTGVLKNDNGLRAVAQPTTNQTIGDTTYTPAQIGTLRGSVGFDDTATFLGLGWDWSRDKRIFGMSFDIGVVDQGDPIVTLTGSGTLLGDPAFQQDIDAEEAELRGSLDGDVDVVPYLSLGFVFRF